MEVVERMKEGYESDVPNSDADEGIEEDEEYSDTTPEDRDSDR